MTLDEILDADPEAVADALLALHENQWFDRKSARVSPRDLSHALIALANTEGGVVVIGLWNGRVEGVRSRPRQVNAWRQAARDLTVPPVTARFREIDCRTADGDVEALLVAEVEASERVHATPRDDVYLRDGDVTRLLRPSEAQELIFDKGQAFFEATPIDIDADGLDDALLASYAARVGHPDPTRLLSARGLITRSGSLTLGALLLFGVHPQARYPEAAVRVLRYRGIDRGSGSRQQLTHDTRVEGPLPALIDGAAEEILRRMPVRQALGSDGLFGPVGLIPHDAWLEGLVNAVIHRSYSVMGDHVRIEIFDDRMEIESPGRFPGLVDPSDPRAVTRFARNPRIARVCSDLGFGQELGEGIRRMFEEMRLAGLADPTYRQTSGSVVLTLTAEAVDRALEERLPAGARDLLAAIRTMSRPSTGELSAVLARSRPVVIRQLRALEDAGLIEWIGKSAKDPRAYWRRAKT